MASLATEKKKYKRENESPHIACKRLLSNKEEIPLRQRKRQERHAKYCNICFKIRRNKKNKKIFEREKHMFYFSKECLHPLNPHMFMNT